MEIIPKRAHARAPRGGWDLRSQDASPPSCMGRAQHPTACWAAPAPAHSRVFFGGGGEGRGWQEGVLLTRFPRLAGRVDEDSLDLHHPPLLAGVSRGAGGCGEQLRGRVGGFWRSFRLSPHNQAASSEFGVWDITTDPMGLPAARLPRRQPRVPLLQRGQAGQVPKATSRPRPRCRQHPAGRLHCLRERCSATPQAPKEPRGCS